VLNLLEKPAALIAAGLFAVVVAVYAQTFGYGFQNLDDPQYISEDLHVFTGLSVDNVRWALTTTHASHWHPLTWASHMLDCDLYGLQAGGHHATSVLIHAATAVLLFVALRRYTGQLWGSAFVAAAFALHPLRVESVAWIAERKDVLSGFFFVLTLLAYERYVRCPSVSRYAFVALALALGLMAKSMLVTTPCVLLLLDYWPLRRLGRWAFAEKFPLLLLAAVSAIATARGHSHHAMTSWEALPLEARLKNAAFSYGVYLWQTVYPSDLAVIYPHPGDTLHVVDVVATCALLAILTAAAVGLRRRAPAVLVGWLWFLGMLVPVSGIMQVGGQGHADRYTYLPQIGLFVALAFGAPWSRVSRRIVIGAAVSVLAVWALLSAHQVGTWKNPDTLYTQALACNEANFYAHYWYGHYLGTQERYREAAHHLSRALECTGDPTGEVRYKLGLALIHLGRDGEAAEHFEQVYRQNPRMGNVRALLVTAHVKEGTQRAQAGTELLRVRRFNAALPHFRAAVAHFDADLAVAPNFEAARRNRELVLLQLGETP
jgi:tetratricopeptide (TPR) repeat protein